jgi:hypothetical protein
VGDQPGRFTVSRIDPSGRWSTKSTLRIQAGWPPAGRCGSNGFGGPSGTGPVVVSTRR